MKVLTFVLLCLVTTSVSAQDAPSRAPAIKSFALNTEATGAASNSVNLSTGDVALPLNLVSLPGKGGLDASVSISCTSNVQNIVNTWNLDAPAGILGLGWSMETPKIIADLKQTGTREDDTYYLVEGGASNKLVRTTSGSDAGGPYYTYETKNYQFWKIKYYYDNVEIYGSAINGSGPNKWEITKEDGIKYIYGDNNSGRKTLQYTVRWENWIGNSSQTIGQTQVAHTWNLSEIKNVWNEKIVFEYDNVENFVGSTSGKKHTEASYIKEVTDTYGRKIKFFYNEKNSEFFVEPHTEISEPDAYQEFYERKYLDHIDVLNELGNKAFSIQFGYSSINSGTNKAKMLLTSVTQKSGLGRSLPPITIEYYATGSTTGVLKKISYPTGGTVTYEYSQGTIGHSNRELTINSPNSTFAEPKFWIMEDYVLVAWRQLEIMEHITRTVPK